MLDKTQNSIDKAKIALFKDKRHTFIMTILFGLELEANEELSGGMLSTDGYKIYLNEEYINTRDTEGLKADLIHETYHVLFNHIGSAKNKDKRRYNFACDYFINLLLDGGDSGVTIDDTFILNDKYKDWALIDIYNDIKGEDIPKNYKADIIEGRGDTSKLDAHIKGLISKGKVTAEMRNSFGNIDSRLQRYVNDVLEPKINWREVLIDYFSSYVKGDTSWRKPERRYLPDLYMPSNMALGMGKISLYIDCSGSIGNKEYSEFISEIQEIVSLLNPEETLIYNWGSSIDEPTAIDKYSPIIDQIELVDKGGTNINTVIDSINTNKPEISIVFSDGEFQEEYDNVDTDVLWVIKDNTEFESKFGTVIHYENVED